MFNKLGTISTPTFDIVRIDPTCDKYTKQLLRLQLKCSKMDKKGDTISTKYGTHAQVKLVSPLCVHSAISGEFI